MSLTNNLRVTASEEARTTRVSLTNLQVTRSEERFTPKTSGSHRRLPDGSQPVGHRLGCIHP